MLPTEYEIYLAVAGSILLLLAVLSAFVISINTYRKRRARLEREIVETHYKTREQTLLQVSRDLHDDIGASLSGIQLFNQLLQQQIREGRNEHAAVISGKIDTYIDDIVTRVSDMAWLFKPGNDTVQALMDKIRRYAADIAGTKNIAFTIVAAPDATVHTLGLLQQKSAYLICKEAINNAVKYADCTGINLNISYQDQQLFIAIRDDGKGFDTSVVHQRSGLNNMQQRASEMQGHCSISSLQGNGSVVAFSFPIATISYS